MLKQIDITECHRQLLHIAIAFDKLCQKHHIPYYMLGGTMLGAIRHQGFIPWMTIWISGFHVPSSRSSSP